MTADEFALLQGIRENPADDTPRLVYADFLEERGDEASVAEAEYIRLECELDQTLENLPRFDDLDFQAKELSKWFVERWRQRVELRILERYPTIRFGIPPDGDVGGMDDHRGMISTVSIAIDVLQKYPDLVPLIGPIEHLCLHFSEGHILDAGRISENWNIRKLKILEVHSRELTFDEMLTRFAVMVLRYGSELSSVPILKLVTSNRSREAPLNGVTIPIFNGQLNPVVMFQTVNITPSVTTTVVDPLNLWPLVVYWAEFHFRTYWQFVSPSLTAEQRERIPSARYPHLVRYYQLEGLPPALPETERVPKAVPPKRGILTQAARWFRRPQ